MVAKNSAWLVTKLCSSRVQTIFSSIWRNVRWHVHTARLAMQCAWFSRAQPHSVLNLVLAMPKLYISRSSRVSIYSLQMFHSCRKLDQWPTLNATKYMFLGMRFKASQKPMRSFWNVYNLILYCCYSYATVFRGKYFKETLIQKLFCTNPNKLLPSVLCIGLKRN